MKKLITLILAPLLILFLASATSFAEEEVDLTQGLVAYYPFSGNANDASGNGNHGAVDGATLVEDRYGNPNSAYSFNGYGDYIEIPYSESLNIEYGITIGFWMNRNADQSLYYPAETKAYIVKQIDGISLWVLDNSGCLGGLGNSKVTPLQEWVHYCFTVNSDGYATMYKNGERVCTGRSTIPMIPSENVLRIGMENESHGSYNGLLDEVVIYDRALSATEVQQLVVSENVVPDTPDTPDEPAEDDSINLNKGLVAYYPFNGNANDASGNGNHGTVYDAALVEDRYGEPDSAYSFDGDRDYIEIPHSESFNIENEISFSFWMRRNEDQALHYPGEYKSFIFVKPTDGNENFRLDSFSFPLIQLYDTGGMRWNKGTYGTCIGSEGAFSGVCNDVTGEPSIVPLHTWAHYCFTRDMEGNTKLYENGVLVDEGSFRAGDSLLISSVPLRIGMKNGAHYSYNGILDEITIYNRTLSATEVKWLMISDNVVTDVLCPDCPAVPTTIQELLEATSLGSSVKEFKMKQHTNNDKRELKLKIEYDELLDMEDLETLTDVKVTVVLEFGDEVYTLSGNVDLEYKSGKHHEELKNHK